MVLFQTVHNLAEETGKDTYLIYEESSEHVVKCAAVPAGHSSRAPVTAAVATSLVDPKGCEC